MATYTENLINQVISESDSSTWEDAVQEWEIEDCDEDKECKSNCICGKEELRYLYTIRNQNNGNELFPIGSRCIKKFERDDLNYTTSLYESLFKLLHAIKDKKRIELTTDYFSRKLLDYLYEQEAFKPITRAGEALDKSRECAYSVLSLPIHTEMTKDIQNIIISTIIDFYNNK